MTSSTVEMSAQPESAFELQPARLRVGLMQALRHLELDWTGR